MNLNESIACEVYEKLSDVFITLGLNNLGNSLPSIKEDPNTGETTTVFSKDRFDRQLEQIKHFRTNYIQFHDIDNTLLRRDQIISVSIPLEIGEDSVFKIVINDSYNSGMALNNKKENIILTYFDEQLFNNDYDGLKIALF